MYLHFMIQIWMFLFLQTWVGRQYEYFLAEVCTAICPISSFLTEEVKFRQSFVKFKISPSNYNQSALNYNLFPN